MKNKILNTILKEGETLIHLEGMKSFTIESLASILSISKKTIYQFFPTKEFLIKKIIIFRAEKVSEKCKIIMKNESDPIAQFIKIRDIIIKSTNKIDLNRLIYIKTRYPEIWEIVEKYRLERIDTYTKIFLLAKEKGYLRKSLDPVFSAKLFVNILNSSIQPDFMLKNEINFSDMIFHLEKILVPGFFTNDAINIYKSKKG